MTGTPSKMRIAFVHDWTCVDEQTYSWRDGLYAALVELKKRGHEVLVLTCGDRPREIVLPELVVHVEITGQGVKEAIASFGPDVILHWADTTRPNAFVGRELGIPQALCFAGGNPLGDTLGAFDLVFVESEVYKQRYLAAGVNVRTAFGTNTKLFDPENVFVKNQPKTYDLIFPATYANWKRHKLFAEAARGYKAVTCGYMYSDHEMDCWGVCQEAGVTVLPHVSAEVLRNLYAASRVCVVTSDSTGGSQRTVLEAMAMNVPVVVMQDGDKCSEYTDDASRIGHVIGSKVRPESEVIRKVVEGWLSPLTRLNSREYVLSKWSEVCYADALEAGLNTLCNKN